MPLAPPGQLRIGDALIAARARADLDLKQVEERTKIRAKYLRALEEEDWDELPSASHAKGFLRTYAQLLGLDAELLVDEYRRQVEPGAEGIAGPLSDRLLERRRSAGGRQGPRPRLDPRRNRGRGRRGAGGHRSRNRRRSAATLEPAAEAGRRGWRSRAPSGERTRTP